MDFLMVLGAAAVGIVVIGAAVGLALGLGNKIYDWLA